MGHSEKVICFVSIQHKYEKLFLPCVCICSQENTERKTVTTHLFSVNSVFYVVKKALLNGYLFQCLSKCPAMVP